MLKFQVVYIMAILKKFGTVASQHPLAFMYSPYYIAYVISVILDIVLSHIGLQ